MLRAHARLRPPSPCLATGSALGQRADPAGLCVQPSTEPCVGIGVAAGGRSGAGRGAQRVAQRVGHRPAVWRRGRAPGPGARRAVAAAQPAHAGARCAARGAGAVLAPAAGGPPERDALGLADARPGRQLRARGGQPVELRRGCVPGADAGGRVDARLSGPAPGPAHACGLCAHLSGAAGAGRAAAGAGHPGLRVDGTRDRLDRRARGRREHARRRVGPGGRPAAAGLSGTADPGVRRLGAARPVGPPATRRHAAPALSGA